jgi:hypothetical protein
MAEVVYRLRTIVQHQRTADLKALRLNRKNNRGLMVDTATGFSTRNRRGFLNKADATGLRAGVPVLRERYQRKGWYLQDAITTPQGA